MNKTKNETAKKAALDFHEFPKPGKLETRQPETRNQG